MTPEFDAASSRVLRSQLRLLAELRALRLTIPMDDQGSFDEQVLNHQGASDGLVMWLARYGRPRTDPTLGAEGSNQDPDAEFLT